MSETTCTIQTGGREQVSAYLDGELSPSDELRFEMHTAACAGCFAELNEQKRLLSVLDSAFDETFAGQGEAEIELPKDFAKIVATRAESNFNGLRRPQEWLFAALLIALLFVMGIGFGIFLKKSEIVSLLLNETTKIIWAIGNFFIGFGYDVSLSLVVVFRSLSRHFFFSSGITAFILLVCLLVSFFLLSRLLLRFHKN